jgi:hypothetical protein
MNTKKVEGLAMTDPARELVELCEALRVPSSADISGEKHLAAHFNVDAWSIEFFEIVFTIMQRIKVVSDVVASLEIDEDFRTEILQHVAEIGEAFSAHSLRNKWSAVAATHTGPKNVQPLKGVAGLVRQKVSYRKLSAAEIDEVKNQVADLMRWLGDHQLSQHDFIRQALIEGLNKVDFRLKRLQWLGWGYTLDSLREVIAAYMLLEHTDIVPEINPDAEAALRKVGGFIKTVYEKMQTAKGVAETGDWLARAYVAGSLIYQGAPAITAFLPAP